MLLILLITFRLSAQVWVVPSENEVKKSSFVFDDASRKAGADIYNTSCKSCHGEPGKSNAIHLVPPPPDMASARMQNNSDGSLQYKITTGRGPMPSFKNTLSGTDVWRVISYIRGFNDKYKQEIAINSGAGGTNAQNVKIHLNWLKETNQVQASVSGMKDKEIQPLAGVEVKLFAQRYFGNLMIDEARNTDALGKALFNFPKDLPGDSAGFVQLFLRLTDESAFGEARTDTSIAIGVPTYRPPLNEKRAMWNVVQKTPIWLLLAYSIVVLGTWGFIIYVILLIRAIYKAGRKKEAE